MIVISPSAMASMSLYLPSMIVGHRTMSKAAATSTMCSWMLTMAMSQPPHEAAPKMASLGLAADLTAAAAGLAAAFAAPLDLAAGLIGPPPPHGAGSAPSGVAGGPPASPPVASQAVSRSTPSMSTMLPAGQLSGPRARTSSVTRAISLARRTPSAALAQTSWSRAGSMPSASIVRCSSWKRRRAL